jgi:hypothetical protein
MTYSFKQSINLTLPILLVLLLGTPTQATASIEFCLLLGVVFDVLDCVFNCLLLGVVLVLEVSNTEALG